MHPVIPRRAVRVLHFPDTRQTYPVSIMGGCPIAKVDGDKIKERYEKTRAEYKEHQKRERLKRRKLKARKGTERKIVAGEFVLFLLENGEYDREWFMTRIDKYLDDDRRRSLFGLEIREEASETTERDASLPLVEQGSGES